MNILAIIVTIILKPLGDINEHGEFYPNAFGHLLIAVFSWFLAMVITAFILWILVSALIIAFDGVEALQTPELFRDPLCFLIDRCN